MPGTSIHLLLAGLAAISSSQAFGDQQLYRLDIRVASGVNRQPAVGGTVKVTGPGVQRIEYPDPSVVSRGFLQTRGIELGSGGRLVLLVTEGTYNVTLTMAGHESASREIEIPWDDEGPAAGEIPTRQLSVELAVSPKQ
jgi:hypothetical protein